RTQEEALVLFDPGSQSSFVSKKLANRLNLTEATKEELKLFSFDYLTEKLQIIAPTSNDINYITRQRQLDESEGCWRRPDIIIGIDYFLEFMQPYKYHHIDQFWKLEVIGIQEQPNDQNDEKALEQFKNCITKENNMYQVCWPWKDSKGVCGTRNVLINEPEIPRGMWKLAKIKEIKRGRDGQIRNVIIELPHGKLLDRPVNLLYPLEVDDNEIKETNQQSTPEIAIQHLEPEEPIARRTRRAT
ncbi:unnamed protein product, partial [Onchocerca ochengi]|uniref:DUF5641 domain-containing protein n=1 Tax=Onchocerca ochengi TaxID=42157 RepID=A0A182EVU4_ONCOC